MVDTILDLLTYAVASVGQWFGMILDSTGMGSVYISVMMVVLTMGILMGPLLGAARHGLSDHASKRKNSSKKSDDD